MNPAEGEIALMDSVARSDYESGAQPEGTCVSKILTFISSVMLMIRRIYAAKLSSIHGGA